MKAKEQKRLLWIDIVRGIAILFVIIGHTYSSDEGFGAWCINMMLAVELPVFFLLSGYLFSDSGKFPAFVKKKAKSLLGPYAATAVLCLIYWICTHCLYQDPTSFSEYLYNLVKTFAVGSGRWISFFGNWSVGALWFLPALFFAQILFYMIIKVSNHTKTWFRLPLALLCSMAGVWIGHRQILPWSFDCAMYAVIFLEVGYEIRQRKIEEWDLPDCIYALFAVLWILYAMSIHLDINTRSYGSYFSSLIMSVSGCICLVKLSKWLTKSVLITNVLAYLGRNSLVIMIFHNLMYCGYFHMDLLTIGSSAKVFIIAKLIFSTCICELFRHIPLLSQIYHLPKDGGFANPLIRND